MYSDFEICIYYSYRFSCLLSFSNKAFRSNGTLYSVKLQEMLKFNKNQRSLSKISETNFKKENLLERTDLQAAIIGSWDVFRNEIGFSSAVLIGQEINPDDSTSDRLDILALDAEPKSSYLVFCKETNRCRLQNG